MNSQIGDYTENAISAISIKPPPFWKASPQFWFDRLEAQFELAGITAQKTKFNYVLSVLDGDIIRIISDIIRQPHLTEPYENLKTNLINRLSTSEVSKLKQLLSDLALGDRQPSQLLREMRELGGDKVSEELLKSLWLQRLPDNMQAILYCNPGTLSDLASCADKISEVYNKPSVFSCSKPVASSNSDAIWDRLNFVTKQLDELQLQVNRLYPIVNYRSRSRSRSSSSNKFRRNKSTLCWYHSRFSEKALKCIQPCSFNSNTLPKN